MRELGDSFQLAAFMPIVKGLPEGLSQEEFRREFGSTSDPRFLDEEAKRAASEPKFLSDAPATEIAPLRSTSFDDNEATRASNMDGMAQIERNNRPPQAPAREERTRTVDIRNDRSISDIDWDLD